MNQPDLPELWSREKLSQWQLSRLQVLLQTVVPANPFWTEKLKAAGIAPAAIRTRDDLRTLPLTSKAELAADQAANAPYGRNLTFGRAEYSRLHQTSGTTTGQPLRWLDTPASWNWLLDCWTTIYRLMKLRRGNSPMRTSSINC